MSSWSKYPFIRLLVPLTGGILICYFAGYSHIIYPLAIAATAFLLLFCFNFFFARNLSYSFQWLSGAIVNLAIVLLGYSITLGTFMESKPHHFAILTPKADAYIAKVTGQPQELDKTYKVSLKIISTSTDGKIVDCIGNVICYISKDSTKSNTLQYGDVVLFATSPTRPEKPGSPWQFDYRKYLENNGIFHTVYLKEGDYQVIGNNEGSTIKAFALATRGKFLDELHENGLTGEEYTVASALLAGYDKEIDRDLYNAYSGAGVIHILSVSGLHVGIIYMMAQAFFSFFKRFSRLKFIEPVAIISIVWMYALITGLAPPVLRSSLMFTLIVVGKATHRQANTLNTLAAAAFILLITDPRLLFNVGFQLSFSAVAGIVILQPFFRGVWWPKNPLVKNIWDLTTVSFAAQIFTAPFVLYYFHRFPTYFLFTNLLAIPLSGLVMYTGVLFLFTSFLPFVESFIISALSYEIKALNYIVRYVENLPGSVIENIYITFTSAVVLMGFIVFIILFVYRNKKPFMWTATACLLMLSVQAGLRTATIVNQNEIIFHKSRYHPLVSFIQGSHHTILTDSLTFQNFDKVRYQIEGLEIMAGLDNPCIRCITSTSMMNEDNGCNLPEFYSFDNKRLVVVSGNCILPIKQEKLRSDYILLCNNPSCSIAELSNCFPGAILIADNSCSKWMVKELKEDAAANHLKFYSLSDQGTLLIDLNG